MQYVSLVNATKFLKFYTCRRRVCHLNNSYLNDPIDTRSLIHWPTYRQCYRLQWITLYIWRGSKQIVWIYKCVFSVVGSANGSFQLFQSYRFTIGLNCKPTRGHSIGDYDRRYLRAKKAIRSTRPAVSRRGQLNSIQLEFKAFRYATDPLVSASPLSALRTFLCALPPNEVNRLQIFGSLVRTMHSN